MVTDSMKFSIEYYTFGMKGLKSFVKNRSITNLGIKLAFRSCWPTMWRWSLSNSFLRKHCDHSCLLACVADGELYAGTVSNFQGNEPIIYKSLSQGTALKTENSLNWLQGTVVWMQSNGFYYHYVQEGFYCRMDKYSALKAEKCCIAA